MVYVGRPWTFGNPFTLKLAIEAGYLSGPDDPAANQFLADCFRDWLMDDAPRTWWQGPESDARRAAILATMGHLRGKNLACFCPLDRPCHADVLLDLANR